MPSVYLATVDVATLWPAVEAAADQIGVGIVVLRIDVVPPRFVYVSERAARLMGRTLAEVADVPAWTILNEADRAQIRELIETRDGKVPLQIEFSIARPDGTLIPAAFGAFRIQTSHGLLSFGYVRDLTIEREALEALHRSEERFRYLVEAAPDGVVILVAGRIVFINPTAARLLGAESPAAILGQPIGAYLPPQDAADAAQRIATMFRTGEEMSPNDYGVLADPHRVVEIKSIRCEWEAKPAVLAFARDVTVRKALAKKLVEADRLTALGTLSAGVAHEINNPLTYAQLSLQGIERTVAHADVSDELKATITRQLEDAQHGITRVATITSSLRMFARVDDAPPGPIDVIGVVDRAIEMVANDLRRRALLVRRIDAVPHAIGNVSRLEQVLVNLLLNALQAFEPVAAEARIDVVVEHVGDDVSIRVSDTGRGIPAALRDRVFDPFFTTKPVGEGMGLGLSVCRSIVEGFGGQIELDSNEGRGTTVTVRLRAHVSPPATRPPSPTIAFARVRVLVIDDDPLVRNVLGKILSQHHDVTTAEDGAAALVAVERDSFGAILCDMTMPGIDGCEVHRRLAVEHPGIERRIIFITGGTFGPAFDHFLATVGNRCLTKPFRIEQVLDAIAEVTG